MEGFHYIQIMKTITTLLIVLLFAGELSAKKNNSNTDDSYKRVYIALSFTPTATYRYLNKNIVPGGTNNGDIQNVIDNTNSISHPQIGCHIGLKLGVNIKRWFAIETGVQYSFLQYRYSSNHVYSHTIWNGSNFIPADSFQINGTSTYHYFNIPLAITFTAGKKFVRGVFTLGTDFDFLMRHQTYWTETYPDGSVLSNKITSDTHNFNTFNISPFLGIGLDLCPGKTIKIRIMPVAQMQALQNINTPITERLWNVGLNVSVLFGFIKAEN